MSFKKIIFLIFILVVSTNAQASKLDKIKLEKNIKVCIWPDYYGISYLDKRTQKLIGIDSDLAQELANDLGVKLEFISSSFSKLIKDVTEDRCDIAMFAIANTAYREEKLRFTTAHLKSDIYAITTKNNRKINKWDDIDKEGVIVAVTKGTYHENVMKKKLKNAKLLVVSDLDTRRQEVHAGRADVFMTDYPFARKMLKQSPWAKLISTESTYHLSSYAWVMNYGDDKFFNRVEKFISDIKKDGRLLKYAKKNKLEKIINLK